MKIHELKPAKGARKAKRRKGRGMGSGRGKTSTRGHKGQGARAASTKRYIGFEGGQMPLIRRIPKRGFNAQDKLEYSIVNLEKLNIFKEDAHITLNSLKSKGLIRSRRQPVKILGKGKLKKKLTVEVQAFSKSAKVAIKKAGGTVKLVVAKSTPKPKEKE